MTVSEMRPNAAISYVVARKELSILDGDWQIKANAEVYRIAAELPAGEEPISLSHGVDGGYSVSFGGPFIKVQVV